MEKTLNFDLLFKEHKTLDITRLEIFRKAALFYSLDADKDFSGLDKNELNHFMSKALKHTDGTYRLNDEDRSAILHHLKSTGELQVALGSLHRRSTYTSLLKNLAEGETLDINEFSNEELYYGIYLADIFPDLLNKKELQTLYQRQQFFKQFDRLTQNFVGQGKHLNRISEYLDWMPKSGLLNKINHTLRNIINWHEKPPLLIKGVGGVGKSTIIAQTILNHNGKNKKKTLPFIYIDFDLPGFSLQEPLTILIEALRQISIQYPTYKGLTDRISERITDLIHRQNEPTDETMRSSNASTRVYIYEVIQDLIKDRNLNLDQIGRNPIFVVFDSFEEMQYRASSTELFTFYQFIKEVSEILPRFRPVFVGRSELYTDNERFKVEIMEIEAFDEESTNALLKKKGVSTQKERDFIYHEFGGNPLMLNLATDLMLKEGDLTNLDTNKIKDKKWLYLIRRILGHIHDDRVRKIAAPGMLVRFIDINVICEVLAEPTGLGYVEQSEAELIYEELRKEVSLISKSNDGKSFAFRQDLRMMCEPMILEQYPKEFEAIREKAIAYYSKYSSIEMGETRSQYQAEYYFHLLKKDIVPEELNAIIYKELRPYLEHSIIELPIKAQRIINSYNNQISSGKIRQKANLSIEQWENSNIGLVQDALHGELVFLDEIYGLLQENHIRKHEGFSEFGKMEALLYQRINKIELSQNCINRAIYNANKNESPDLYIDFQLLQIQNFEYQERYDDAIKLCRELKVQSHKTSFTNRKKLDFLFCRVQRRLGVNQNIGDNFKNALDFSMYNTDIKFSDTKWEFIFNKLDLSNTEFKSHNIFNREFRQLRKTLVNHQTLEGYAKKHIGYFLKDMTFTGHFHIVLRDVLFIQEIIDSNPERDRNIRKEHLW